MSPIRIIVFGLFSVLSSGAWTGALVPPCPIPWSSLDGSSSGGGISKSPSATSEMPEVGVGPDGHPVVVWKEFVIGTSMEIYARRWNGSLWEELDGSGSGGGISKSPTAVTDMPSVAVDTQGRIAVAWKEYTAGTSGGEIHVRRWNGTIWEELALSGSGGGISKTTSGISDTPAIAVDGQDRIVVAWKEYVTGTSGGEIVVRRWDGSVWEELDFSASTKPVSASSTVTSEQPSVAATPAGDIYVAWKEFVPGTAGGEILVRRWMGSGPAWEAVGGGILGLSVSVSPTLISELPQIAVGPGGAPVVAWREMLPGTSGDIFVRTWSSSAWVGMDGTPASENVSGTTTPTEQPCLATDGMGMPWVAWKEFAAGTSGGDIHLRRWNGAIWEELSASATVGGLSQTLSTTSDMPDIAVSRDGNAAVAWKEFAATTSGGEIYVKALYENAPTGLQQARTDGTSLAPGDFTGASLHLTAGVNSACLQPGSMTRLEIEVQPVAVHFSGIATHSGTDVPSGSIVTIPVMGLPPGSYHWRARSRNPDGLCSWWVSFGGNPETDADFNVVTAPPVPQPLAQVSVFGAVLAVGAVTNDSRVALGGILSAPSGPSSAVLEIEARVLGTAFQGIPNGQKSVTIPGEQTVVVPSGLGTGSYHWQARTVDAGSGLVSNWVSFGGNPENEADFVVQHHTSDGPRLFLGGCSGAALAVSSPAGWLVLLTTLAAVLLPR